MRELEPKKFSDAQAQELLRHFCTHLEPDYAAFLVEKCDALCASLSPPQKIGRRARRRPPASHPDFGKWIVLESLIKNLRVKPRRGRPRKYQRADLIRQISEHYPFNIPRQARGGYFETTVKMVLKFAGFGFHEVAVDIIHDALKGRFPPNES